MQEKKPRSIQAVVFDFDGVILESAEIKTRAFVELFCDYPHFVDAIEKYHLENQGVSRFLKFRWIYENLIRQTLTVEREFALGEKFSDLVFEAIMRAPFVPGAIELLRFLDARSIPAFIASGTPHDELQNIVRLRDLNPWFRAVFGTPASKDEILKNILSAYDLRADLVLFIGDATTDHIAARNSGVNFLARNTPALEKYWNEHHVVTTENLAYAIEAYEWH